MAVNVKLLIGCLLLSPCHFVAIRLSASVPGDTGHALPATSLIALLSSFEGSQPIMLRHCLEKNSSLLFAGQFSGSITHVLSNPGSTAGALQNLPAPTALVRQRKFKPG